MTNYERYKFLNDTYKISSSKKWNKDKKCCEYVNVDDYDVVYESAGAGYAHHKYIVLKNAPSLSDRDLAIICDRGSLPWGFRRDGKYIVVHTD